MHNHFFFGRGDFSVLMDVSIRSVLKYFYILDLICLE